MFGVRTQESETVEVSASLLLTSLEIYVEFVNWVGYFAIVIALLPVMRLYKSIVYAYFPSTSQLVGWLVGRSNARHKYICYTYLKYTLLLALSPH